MDVDVGADVKDGILLSHRSGIPVDVPAGAKRLIKAVLPEFGDKPEEVSG